MTLEEIEVALTDAMNDLADLGDGLEDEELRGKLEMRVRSLLSDEAMKVDAVAKVLSRFKTTADECDAESKRLAARSKVMMSKHTRLAGYVVHVMERTGTKRMEGTLNTFVRIQNPPRADAPLPEMLPLEFQRQTYTIKPETTEQKKDLVGLAESLRDSGLSTNFEAQPDLVALREAMKRGDVIPGAVLLEGTWRLAIR